ncbi:MAG: PD40 domain-containing protein [Anaerolineales bacterium]|nr:PD40 domain-containing protein [Anaerolineales bacterium]
MGGRRALLAVLVWLLAACGPAADPGNPVQTAMSATLTARPLVSPTAPSSPEPGTAAGPGGKIAYVCQYSKRSGRNQICLINADGSGQRILTPAGDYDDFFPSVTPDGRAVLFASSRNGAYQIFEYDLLTGQVRRLVQVDNHRLYAPAASPDNAYIVFYAERAGQSYPQSHNLWIAARDGSNPTQITQRSGGAWDPVWSPDGTQILFASEANGAPQLFVVNADGSGARQVTHLNGLRGRNDWSPDGLLSTYIGPPWERDIYTFDLNGENLRRLTFGLNNLAPSFSPDGGWIAFMSYRDHPLQALGCEIYIMRIDGSDLRRLTDNDICDWQPRWGP